ncbi:MAG: hypothetical protein AD742_06390 [Methylibium sp. NZG]|nr:MAG: hypothetical protein AD742_06390 [Methylibium sp. NZG]
MAVQSRAQQMIAARVTQAAGQRPRVNTCHVVPAPDGLTGLHGWWEHSASPRDTSVLLLEASDYQILQMDAPPVDPCEYRQAARWGIKDLIDFSVEDAALDCLRLPGIETGDKAGTGGAAAKLITVVTRQALVTSAVAQWRTAGLALKVIDIPEMALRNLAVLATGGDACAFIHIGIESAHLILLWQQELCVSRQLGMGGEQLRGLDEWNRQTQLERLALEIQRTIDAFGRQFSAANLGQLWVSSVYDAPGLTQLLGQQLSIEVKAFVPADWIDFDTGAESFDLSRRIDHTLAIGAALREVVPV